MPSCRGRLFRQLTKMKLRQTQFNAMHSSSRSCYFIRKKIFIIKETKLFLSLQENGATTQNIAGGNEYDSDIVRSYQFNIT